MISRTAATVSRRRRGPGEGWVAVMPRALLVGRHRLFLECLARRLGTVGRLRAVATVEGLDEAVEVVSTRAVDLLLVDLRGCPPASLQRLAELARSSRRPKLLVLGLAEGRDQDLSWLRAGADAYLSRGATLEEVGEAVERVLAGEVYCSPQATYALFRQLSDISRERRRHRQVESLTLTPRELEVLTLLADGLSNRQIARHACLSIHTVKNHVHHILRKMEVDCREAAVREAFARRWLGDRRRGR